MRDDGALRMRAKKGTNNDVLRSGSVRECSAAPRRPMRRRGARMMRYAAARHAMSIFDARARDVVYARSHALLFF